MWRKTKLVLTVSWRKRIDANIVRGPFGCEAFYKVGNSRFRGVVKDLKEWQG